MVAIHAHIIPLCLSIVCDSVGVGDVVMLGCLPLVGYSEDVASLCDDNDDNFTDGDMFKGDSPLILYCIN